MNSDELKGALERVIAGTASGEEREALKRALMAGKMVFAGERGGSAGGNISESIVITGDNNQIQVQLSDALYEQIKERLFPPGTGIAPPAPALIFIGREEALQDVKVRLGVADSASDRVGLTGVCGWPGVGKPPSSAFSLVTRTSLSSSPTAFCGQRLRGVGRD